MNQGKIKEPDLELVLELLNDTCNLLAREVRRQELEILQLRRQARGEKEGLANKKNRVN